MYGHKKTTTCGGIKLAVRWGRQDNRGTWCELDYTPKRKDSTDGEGPALGTRHQLVTTEIDASGRKAGKQFRK